MSAFNSILSPRTMVSAAIVGLVGAAGVFLYERLYAEKRRAMLVKDVERLDKQVATMRSELEVLRELQKESQLLKAKQRRQRKHKRNVSTAPTPDVVDASRIDYSDYTSGSDYLSAIGNDNAGSNGSDTDEFYDLHSDSEPESSSFINSSSVDGANGDVENKSPRLERKT